MTSGSHIVCLMLGSNIRPEENLKQAIHLLRKQVSVDKISSVWKTPAVGSPGPDFLNAAVLMRTDLDAAEIKESILRPLETKLGRVRVEDKNAPRTIDLDIIIFDGLLMDEDLWHQAYLAVPISELLPDYPSQEGILLIDAAKRLAGENTLTLMPDILDNAEN